MNEIYEVYRMNRDLYLTVVLILIERLLYKRLYIERQDYIIAVFKIDFLIQFFV